MKYLFYCLWFRFRPPSFEGTASEDTIIDADTGSTVIFDCKVTALRDKTVNVLYTYIRIYYTFIYIKVIVTAHTNLIYNSLRMTGIFLDAFDATRRLFQVSWIRVSDDENLELLTVDLDTHTADARYLKWKRTYISNLVTQVLRKYIRNVYSKWKITFWEPHFDTFGVIIN